MRYQLLGRSGLRVSEICLGALTFGEDSGWGEYSLLERTPERELIPMAAALGLTVTAWSPLANGLLSGKYRVTDTGMQTEDGKSRLGSTRPGIGVIRRSVRIFLALYDA